MLSAQFTDISRIPGQAQATRNLQQKWDSLRQDQLQTAAVNGDSLSTLFGQGFASFSTQNWLQSSNLDSLSTIPELKSKTDHIASAPQLTLLKVDSLIQVKTQLLQQKILNLGGKSAKLDSMQNVLPLHGELSNLELDQYSQELDRLIDLNKANITDLQELAWIENYTSQLDQIDGVLGQYAQKALNIEELGQLQSLQQQLGAISQESHLYFKEGQGLLNGIGDDNALVQALEKKVGHRIEFQKLKKQMAAMDKISRDQEQQLDQDHIKQQMLAKAKSMGAQQFSGRQHLLKAAQEKLAKYKKKYSSVQSTKDLSTAVKRNSLEGKPLSERLVLGGTFQVNPSFTQTGTNISTATSGTPNTRKVPTSVDISPLLGYGVNKKLTVGVGGTYRAILEIDNFKSRDQVYGYRGFIQQHAIKGFFVHGEYENLNTAKGPTDTGDKVNRSWQPGGLAGMGREFTFIKEVKGQVMVLYNFLHEDGGSPYRKPWVIRFGFIM